LIDKNKVEIIVKKLDKLGLIKISYREDKIYGFMETEKGEKLFHSKEYDNMLREVEED